MKEEAEPLHTVEMARSIIEGWKKMRPDLDFDMPKEDGENKEVAPSVSLTDSNKWPISK
jgi:hypothetical protein